MRRRRDGLSFVSGTLSQHGTPSSRISWGTSTGISLLMAFFHLFPEPGCRRCVWRKGVAVSQGPQFHVPSRNNTEKITEQEQLGHSDD